MSLSHCSDDNSYHAMEERRVQNIIIQAVDCKQLSVLPSISTAGNLANDPKRDTERKDATKAKSNYSPVASY